MYSEYEAGARKCTCADKYSALDTFSVNIFFKKIKIF